MEERLPMRRTPGISRSTMRLWGMIIVAIGALGRGVLQTRLLGIGSNTGSQLMELLNMPGAMSAATAALVMEALETTAVPIFAALTMDGYEQTGNAWKYLLRVLAVAVVSELPYHFAMDGSPFAFSSRNPVFGVVLALAMLYLYGQFEGRDVKKRLIRCAVFAAALLWAGMLRVQYGMSMVILVEVLWLFRERKTLRYFLAAAAALCCSVGSPLFMMAPLGFLLVHFYNGEEGNSHRLIQYGLYPVLMLLVGVAGWFAF